jgi:vacuolar protein sorting-associated protein 35
MSKDKLPGLGAAGESKDAIDFILQNFGEMNKLWVRMQHQGSVGARSRKELERKNLRQLVGTNLVRLSEILGTDLETYSAAVLPKILEQVINCKDVIAQEYLMDCIIQVFPDEFHLATLQFFLEKCSQLHANVNIKEILRVLMNRIANFARDSPEKIPSDLEMFPLFHKYSSQIIEARQKARDDGGMNLGEDVLPLQVALVNFAASCYPDSLHYVDDVLEFSVQQITGTSIESDRAAIDQATQLLSLPLESISLKILELKHYASLLNLLPADNRKKVAIAISLTASKSAQSIETVEHADALFKYLSPLIVEDVKVTDDNRFEFEQEQHAVAQLFQLLKSDSIEVHYEMYGVARRNFGRGGKDRIEFTLPPLVINSLQLAERAFNGGEGKKTKQIFGFVHETIGALTHEYPELALRLFLMAATCATKCNFEAIAYEFVAQAFIAYEDEISDSKAQYASITYLAGCVQQMTGFSAENYDTLISKCAQHSAKLMLKPQACKAVYTCSHLFWTGTDEEPGYRDEKKVLVCLKRALKIANSCMGEQVPMFIEILNKYLYFFDRECPSITARYLQNLIELIDEHITGSETSAEAQRHYENTLDHIKYKQGLPGAVGARYQEISDSGADGATDE